MWQKEDPRPPCRVCSIALASAYYLASQTPNPGIRARHTAKLCHRSLSPPIRSRACGQTETSANPGIDEYFLRTVRRNRGCYFQHHHRVSSYDYHPNSNFLPARFLFYRFVENDVEEDLQHETEISAKARQNAQSMFLLMASMEAAKDHTSYPLSTPMTFRLPFSCTKSRLSRYYEAQHVSA